MTTPHFLTEVDGGIRLSVHAQPGAKHTEATGLHGGALKIRVHAQPVDGLANLELLRFLAELFSVQKKQIQLKCLSG